jgi:hypothetical protein
MFIRDYFVFSTRGEPSLQSTSRKLAAFARTMFRTACIFVALAVCAATAPPRISLNLVANPAGSDHDYTKTVEINSPSETMPVAKAWDHVDQLISVSTSVKLVEVEHETALRNTALPALAGGYLTVNDLPVVTVVGAAYNAGTFAAAKVRSTYLFEYDATDAAGNHADQLTFVLTINDQTNPAIAGCAGLVSGAMMEAGTATMSSTFCSAGQFTCTDNSEVTPTVLSALPTYDNTFGSSGGALTCLECKDSTTVSGTVSCHDNAQLYGSDGASNTVTQAYSYGCTDSVAPVCTADCKLVETVECAVDEAEEIPTFTDEHVNWSSPASTDRVGDAWATIVATVGTHSVAYSAKDCFDNTGTVTRVYTVEDKTPPTFSWKTDAFEGCIYSHSDLGQATGHDDTSVHVANSWEDLETKFITTRGHTGLADTCEVDSAVTATTQWFVCTAPAVLATDCTTAFDMAGAISACNANPSTCTRPQAGDVYRYEVTASDGATVPNTFTQSTRMEITDCEDPVITVQGCTSGDAYTSFAHSCVTESTAEIGGVYNDAGASCSDFVDGPLSHAVEVHGDIVNRNTQITAEFTIKYDCSDLSGNVAPQASRLVRVTDLVLPVIFLRGASDITYEAGYAYVDEKAYVSDNMAPCTEPASSCVDATKTGDTVNHLVEGDYYITYSATDLSGNEAVEVIRKVTIDDTLKPVIVLHERSNSAPLGDVIIGDEHGHEENTTPNAAGNHPVSLMAETTSVNGWFIGAIACAVTGVALLGLATRKVSTEVPV